MDLNDRLITRNSNLPKIEFTTQELMKLYHLIVQLLEGSQDATDAEISCTSSERRRESSHHPDPLRKEIESLLASEGARFHQRTAGPAPPVEESTAHCASRIHFGDIYQQYEECKTELTPRQWQAVYLRFHVGLTQEEISIKLKIRRSAVCGLLGRAKRTLDAYRREQIRMKMAFLRKYINP